MPGNGYYSRRRVRLMSENPRCHWCKRDLKLYPSVGRKKKLPQDFATIDHLEYRFFGPRVDPRFKQRTLVLACPECNNERSRQELRKYIWRARWKSGTFPFPFGWLGRILKLYRKSRHT